jgi:cell division protein FtsL
MYVKSPMTETTNTRNLRRVDGSGTSGKRASQSRGPKHQKSQKSDDKGLVFSKVEPWKVILGTVCLGILGIFYLSHVFATQRILRDVQRLEQEYEQARQLHDDYQLMYDRLVGPTNIYRKAKELGLINGGTAEQIIHVKTEGGVDE